MSINIVQGLVDEAKRIEEDCLFSSKGHFVASHNLTSLYYCLGIPASVLSAVAGASALSSLSYHVTIAAVLSFIVVSLTAVTTFINPGKKAALHLEAGNEYGALRNELRFFYEIEVPQKDSTTLSERLKQLGDKRNEYNRKFPQVPKRAFLKARKGIEEGEAEYRADKH